MKQLIIDAKASDITIKGDLESLKQNQLSQIFFWGFKKDLQHHSYTLQTVQIDYFLQKLIVYFEKQKLTYGLTPRCKQVLDSSQRKIGKFTNIKQIGRSFKDGDFDSCEFNEFVKYLNGTIARRLKQHQIKAAYHLYLIKNGANFSVPGSGKTSVILSVYEKLKQEGYVNTLFVVGPPSCFRPWITEFKYTFNKKPEYQILAGGQKDERKTEYHIGAAQKKELYLTTFQTLLNDRVDVVNFCRQSEVNVFLVIDEAHYIKQLGGQLGKSRTKYSQIRKISMYFNWYTYAQKLC